MRPSGVHLFHHWRVFPKKDTDGTRRFTLSIDGKNIGKMQSTTLEDAATEAKIEIEQMLNKDNQK